MLNRITDRNKALVHTGRSQVSRALAALKPGSIRLHKGSLSDFVSFLKTFADLIAFFNDEDRLDGTWGDFLEKDLTLGIIDLQSFDPDEISGDFGGLVSELKKGGKGGEQARRKGGEMLVEMLEQVEQMRLVSQGFPAFQEEITTLVLEKFGPLRGKLISTLPTLGWHGDHPIKDRLMKRFGRPWKEGGEGELTMAQGLESLFPLLVDGLRLLKEASQAHLAAILKSGHIAPHTALLFAFHKMMREAGKELDGFVARHLDHYYRTVLRMGEKAGVPDQVHLVFELAENTYHYHLPEGCALDAGEDDWGIQRIYRLDNSIQLSKTKIQALKAVVHDEIPPIYPMLPHAEAAVEAYAIHTEEPEKGEEVPSTCHPFLPGLAIAAPILHLDPANALLKFRFHFEGDSYLGFRDKVFEAAQPSFDPKLESPSLEYKIMKVNQLMADMLVVSYTGEEGEWIKVRPENADFRLVLDGDKLVFNSLELEVLFGPGDPGIGPCFSPDYPQATKAGVPLFKFSLHPAKLHLYYTLVDLVLDQISIEVNVLDLRNLLLQNDFGPLDAGSPFQPFGPLPSIGSSFYIGHPKVFNRNLTQFNLKIEWFDLPDDPLGFPGYYQAYGGINSNQDFKMAISILDQKQWKPREDRQVLDLFETVSQEHVGGATPSERVSRITQITNLEMGLLRVNTAPSGQDLQYLGNNTLDGFIRLELIAPSMAFGHKQYPEVIGRASTEGLLKKRYVPPPNPPYIPTVKSISMDFSARCTIGLHGNDEDQQDWIYHLHPFGVDYLNPEFGLKKLYFLSRYAMGGHLFIGLEAYEQGRELSLLFEINAGGALEYTTPLQVEWACLNGDAWETLKIEEILYDTTNGMTQTGVIRMVIQALSDEASEILPPDLVWLRCYSKTGNEFLRNVLDVRCQAVSATFEHNGNDPAHFQKGLPPGTITGLFPGDVNIAAVHQPHSSFGGRPGEKAADFQVRASERLRHKDRALTAWDCETLVLQGFPQIQKAICLCHLNREYEPAPGELLVIVIPRVEEEDRQEKRVPRIGPATLNAIQAHLQARTSTFTKVNVRNPALEYIRVSMGVRFERGYDDITYYKNKLNEEVYQLLMPWLFDPEAEILPGQDLFAAQFIQFLDSREYIDYIANFSLFHYVDGKLLPPKKDASQRQMARPQSPGALMLSVDQHHFDLIQEDGAPLEGIGMFTTGQDFAIPSEDVPEEEGINQVSIGKDFEIPGASSPSGKNISINIKWS